MREPPPCGWSACFRPHCEVAPQDLLVGTTPVGVAFAPMGGTEDRIGGAEQGQCPDHRRRLTEWSGVTRPANAASGRSSAVALERTATGPRPSRW